MAAPAGRLSGQSPEVGRLNAGQSAATATGQGMAKGPAAHGVGDHAVRPLHRKTFIGVTYVDRLHKYRSCFYSPLESKTVGTGTWSTPYEAARARHERVAQLPPALRMRVSDDFQYDEVDKERPKPAELSGEEYAIMYARAQSRITAKRGHDGGGQGSTGVGAGADDAGAQHDGTASPTAGKKQARAKQPDRKGKGATTTSTASGSKAAVPRTVAKGRPGTGHGSSSTAAHGASVGQFGPSAGYGAPTGNRRDSISSSLSHTLPMAGLRFSDRGSSPGDFSSVGHGSMGHGSLASSSMAMSLGLDSADSGGSSGISAGMGVGHGLVGHAPVPGAWHPQQQQPQYGLPSSSVNMGQAQAQPPFGHGQGGPRRPSFSQGLASSGAMPGPGMVLGHMGSHQQSASGLAQSQDRGGTGVTTASRTTQIGMPMGAVAAVPKQAAGGAAAMGNTGSHGTPSSPPFKPSARFHGVIGRDGNIMYRGAAGDPKDWQPGPLLVPPSALIMPPNQQHHGNNRSGGSFGDFPMPIAEGGTPMSTTGQSIMGASVVEAAGTLSAIAHANSLWQEHTGQKGKMGTVFGAAGTGMGAGLDHDGPAAKRPRMGMPGTAATTTTSRWPTAAVGNGSRWGRDGRDGLQLEVPPVGPVASMPMPVQMQGVPAPGGYGSTTGPGPTGTGLVRRGSIDMGTTNGSAVPPYEAGAAAAPWPHSPLGLAVISQQQQQQQQQQTRGMAASTGLVGGSKPSRDTTGPAATYTSDSNGHVPRATLGLQVSTAGQDGYGTLPSALPSALASVLGLGSLPFPGSVRGFHQPMAFDGPAGLSAMGTATQARIDGGPEERGAAVRRGAALVTLDVQSCATQGAAGNTAGNSTTTGVGLACGPHPPGMSTVTSQGITTAVAHGPAGAITLPTVQAVQSQVHLPMPSVSVGLQGSGGRSAYSLPSLSGPRDRSLSDESRSSMDDRSGTYGALLPGAGSLRGAGGAAVAAPGVLGASGQAMGMGPAAAPLPGLPQPPSTTGLWSGLGLTTPAQGGTFSLLHDSQSSWPASTGHGAGAVGLGPAVSGHLGVPGHVAPVSTRPGGAPQAGRQAMAFTFDDQSL